MEAIVPLVRGTARAAAQPRAQGVAHTGLFVQSLFAHGAVLFEEKGCLYCHEITASRTFKTRWKPMGPPVEAWSEVDDPLAWAVIMSVDRCLGRLLRVHLPEK
jgi:hypothetical protein